MQQPKLPRFQTQPIATATDQIFDAIHQAIVAFELPPGTKLSEAEVAAQFGVSRQPVRDAFFRLSELGFLSIRPQRATLITKISVLAVKQAAFIRSALEVACLVEAIEKMTDDGMARLDNALAQQKMMVKAKDQKNFHEWDDAFHRILCEIAGREHVWSLIKEHKAQMDRARFLSLPFSLDVSFDEHMGIMDAIRDNDIQAAKDCMVPHLNRIIRILPQIQSENPQFFEEPET